MWSQTGGRPLPGRCPRGGPGDVIVLAGKGHETYQEIQGVQYPMDEREIVAQYFSSAPSWERTGNLPAGVV